MDLRDKNGNMLVSETEYQRILEVRTLLPILRSSISKSWRLIDKTMKVLDNSTSAKAV